MAHINHDPACTGCDLFKEEHADYVQPLLVTFFSEHNMIQIEQPGDLVALTRENAKTYAEAFRASGPVHHYYIIDAYWQGELHSHLVQIYYEAVDLDERPGDDLSDEDFIHGLCIGALDGAAYDLRWRSSI